MFPSQFLEMDVPPDFDPDCTLAMETRTDAPSNQCCKVTQLWPQPHIVKAVAHKVRIVNNTSEPRMIQRHEHLYQVRHTTTLDSASAPVESLLSFAADVIRGCRQLILLLRETTTSYNVSCIVPDEKSDTLHDTLTQLVVGLHPLDGPQAVIRVDPAPGFVSLKNTNALQHLGVSIEVGRIKNINKNPVAEKAVQELEEKLLCQEPGGGPVTEVGLPIATARLNARLRNQGELWTQRNQFSNKQIPFV